MKAQEIDKHLMIEYLDISYNVLAWKPFNTRTSAIDILSSILNNIEGYFEIFEDIKDTHDRYEEL